MKPKSLKLSPNFNIWQQFFGQPDTTVVIYIIMLLILISLCFSFMNTEIESSLLHKIEGRRVSLKFINLKFAIKPDIYFAQTTVKKNANLIKQLAQQHNLSPKFVAAIIYTECYFNPSWIQLSEKCLLFYSHALFLPADLSVGVAQIKYSTAKEYFISSDRMYVTHRYPVLSIFYEYYILSFLLSDKKNIQLCVRILASIRDNTAIDDSRDGGMHSFLSMYYNSGKYSTRYSAYARLVSLLINKDPFINKYF